MKQLILALSIIMGLCVSYAGPVYKWVDSDGNFHYSDTPRPGAEKIEISEPQTYSPPSPKVTAPADSGANTAENKHVYTQIEILEPANEATIRNNQGSVDVTVKVEPDLFPGDKVQLKFDGSPLGEPQTNLKFRLSGIYRGSHNISAEVVDAQGNELLSSDSITIFMFRPRVGMGAAGGGAK